MAIVVAGNAIGAGGFTMAGGFRPLPLHSASSSVVDRMVVADSIMRHSPGNIDRIHRPANTIAGATGASKPIAHGTTPTFRAVG